MNKDRVIWGLLFIVAGIALVISKFGFLEDMNVFSTVISFLLVVVIVKSIPRLKFSGVLFPLAFLAIIWDDQLGITAITPWTVLFAAMLGSIGLSMIFHKNDRWFNHHREWKGEGMEITDVEDAGHIRFERNFSGSIKYINSDQFEQASIECNFGGMKVYFDHATMLRETAVVKLDVNFAGVELYVPRSWKVDNRAGAAFGAIKDHGGNDKNAANTLILVGDVAFGGVEIHYI